MKTNLPDIPPLNPPAWCFNGHVHTIARSLFGDTTMPDCRRIEIPTPDDDFLELDVIRQDPDAPVIVLFHGLEGSTGRYYMAELMHRLKDEGYSLVGVNFRSCGSRLNRQPRFYHSGETSDYATVFGWVTDHFNEAPMGAVGFSLGANALLKSLGEQKEVHPLQAAVAVSAPYDLKLGSKRLSKGFNRIYDFRFLRTLRNKLEEKRTHHPGLPRFEGSSLYEFDDQVTSIIHDFDNADHYYESCSSRRFVGDIRKPVLLIHSKEDPLCPIEGMPLETIKNNPALDYVITDEGGHVGFCSRNGNWLNGLIAGYLNRQLSGRNSSG